MSYSSHDSSKDTKGTLQSEELYSHVKNQNTGKNTQPKGLIKGVYHKIKKARHKRAIDDIIPTEPSIVDRHNTTLADNAPLFVFQDWMNDPELYLPSDRHINIDLQEQGYRYGESMRPHKKGNITEVSYKKLPDEVDPSVYPTSTDELNEINSLTSSDDRVDIPNEITASSTNTLDITALDPSNIHSSDKSNNDKTLDFH